MRLERIGENSYFAYLPELEPVWGVLSLLQGEVTHDLCSQIYGTAQIATWRRKYCFLFETFAAIKKCTSVNMIDFLLDLPLEKMSFEALQRTVVETPVTEFLWRCLELDYRPEADRETLVRALTDDAALARAFGWTECDSYLAFAAFVRQSGRYIAEFFALAAELQTAELDDRLQELEPKVERFCREMAEGVQARGAFDFSEYRMGKTFRNRGPYDTFVFLPSCLMPYRACRYFDLQKTEKRQMLFLTLRDYGHSREDTVRSLKAVADPTRYQILTLLASQGPMRGLDLAKQLSLAASTVSHHMEQLKESGLITEEQVKNSKYYGLNRQSAAELLKELKNDLAVECF